MFVTAPFVWFNAFHAKDLISRRRYVVCVFCWTTWKGVSIDVDRHLTDLLHLFQLKAVKRKTLKVRKKKKKKT